MTFRTLTAMCSLPDLTSLTHRLGKRKFHVSRLTLPHFNFADTDSRPTIAIMRLSNWWPVVQAIGSASLDFDAAPFGSVKVQSVDGCVDSHQIFGISLVRNKGASVVNYGFTTSRWSGKTWHGFDGSSSVDRIRIVFKVSEEFFPRCLACHCCKLTSLVFASSYALTMV